MRKVFIYPFRMPMLYMPSLYCVDSDWIRVQVVMYHSRNLANTRVVQRLVHSPVLEMTNLRSSAVG